MTADIFHHLLGILAAKHVLAAVVQTDKETFGRASVECEIFSEVALAEPSSAAEYPSLSHCGFAFSYGLDLAHRDLFEP